MTEPVRPDAIAVIGYACRVPGADSAAGLWENVLAGVESIRRLTGAELALSGVDPREAANPAYVRAKGVLEHADCFDAALFGISPREAALMDPQHRVMLECAWEALEHGGHGAPRPGARVAVYAGVALNSYLLRNVFPHRNAVASEGELALMVGNDKDFVPTRISYQFGFTGPSVNVQTACSTSLVAVQMACQALLTRQCDMALAGGAAVTVPLAHGYLYREGGILSADGHCRPFDAHAAGTVPGNGVGMVLLKRLEDAIAQGDTVHAVIAGSAINNDGADKIGYTAPSVSGQAAVIAQAHALAGVRAGTIGYAEAHGTGTPLGDPIEVAALTQAFRRTSQARGYCALGSVKANIGHLDTAAGVTGLIKAVLAVQHGVIPPNRHFERPNPALALEASPFYLAGEARPWPLAGPRRACVSSFGIGGTNAHVVVEEAPAPLPTGATPRRAQVLCVSGRTPQALEQVSQRLAHALAQDAAGLADVAYTLACGRRALGMRRAVVAESAADAAAQLRKAPAAVAFHAERPVAFLFPGQGAQHLGMGAALARQEPVFQEAFAAAAAVLARWGAGDASELVSPAQGEGPDAVARLTLTANAQAAIFAMQYALSRLWASWGVAPAAVLGHSVGEYAAAVTAGVMTLDAAARLVAARGRLMQALPAGAMLAVPLDEDGARGWLRAGVDISAINAPGACVLGGPLEAVAAIERELEAAGVAARRLQTSHAFHTAMMDPMLDAFHAEVEGVALAEPSIPWISSLTGTWVDAATARDPAYWVRQLREPVRFAAAAGVLLQSPERALLEVGPGDTLATLARRQASTGQVIVSSCARAGRDEARALAVAVGTLWSSGVAIDWARYYGAEARRRVALPTYPFERSRHWIDPPTRDARPPERSGPGTRIYRPAWRLAAAIESGPCEGRWLVLCDAHGVGEALAAQLSRLGVAVRAYSAGECKAALAATYARWLDDARPDHVIHLCSLTGGTPCDDDELAARGYIGVLGLAQALAGHARAAARSATLTVVSDCVHQVTGQDLVQAAKALLLGPVRVLPQEVPEIHCRLVDVEGARPSEARVQAILAECLARGDERVVAHRGRHRWTQAFTEVAPEAAAQRSLRQGGVYLITGGFGALGQRIARHLHETTGARLVLTGRRPVPEAAQWPALFASEEELVTLDLDDAPVEGVAPALRLDAGAIDAAEARAARRHAVRAVEPALARTLDRYCGALAFESLERAGVSLRPGERHTLSALAAQIGVVSPYVRLLEFMLGMLAGEEMLRRDGEAWVVAERPAVTAERLHERALAEHSDFAAVFALLRQCGMRMDEVLRGAVSGVSVLYPRGDSALVEAGVAAMAGCTRHARYARVIAELLERTAATTARPLRVLEIGGGNRFLTREVVPALAGRGVEYWFTDLGRSFVDRAAVWAEEAGHACMRFGELDISREPGPQGWTGTFDVVIGLDVVHATADVAQTLRHLRALLAPGGTLHLVETLPPARWNTMVWGVTPDWWTYSDLYRTISPLLAPAQWCEALAAAGFEAAGSRSGDAPGDCALVFARRPEAGPANAEVLAIQADVTDAAQMAQVVARAHQRFGAIHGVIHAAGVEATGALALRGADASLPGLAAKVRGVRVLEDVLHGEPLDFLMLASSVAVHVGGVGNVEYVAANAFLDAFANERAARGHPVVSVGWDRWRGLGMGATLEARHLERTGEVMGGGLPVEEALACFDAIASVPCHPQVVVAPAGFDEARHAAVRSDITALAARMVPTARHPRPFMATPFVAPEGELERRIAAIWQETLGVDEIGAADDFHQLGGDSLVAIRVASRLREALGVAVGVAALFEAPTVARLAAHVQALAAPEAAPAADAAAAAARREDATEAPLSFAQERLWFLAQLEAGDAAAGAAYNVCSALRLDGSLDAAALQRALDEVVRRHDILRTRLKQSDEGAVQVADGPRRAVLAHADFASGPREAREPAARAHIAAEAAKVFALETAPPVRFILARLDGDLHILACLMHHIVTDGWSMGVLFREVAALYAANVGAGAGTAALPPLPMQYADYARQLRRTLTTQVLAEALGYWRAQMDGAPAVIDLPLDRPRPARQSHRGAVVRFEIDRESTAALRRLAGECNASLFMVLLAGYAALLARYAGQSCVVVGTPVANRDRPELEPLIGVLSNYIPLRIDLDGEPDVAGLVARVRRMTLEGVAHQQLPFEKLVEAAAPDRHLGVTPLFQVALVLQNLPAAPPGLPGLAVRQVDIDRATAKLDLSVLLEESGGAIRGELEYCTDLFEPATAERMARQLVRLLGCLPAYARRPVSSLPLLQAEEARELLERASGADALRSEEEVVHRRFRAQATRTPSAPAVVAGRERLTYAELAARASRLARHLVAMGVAAEDRVAILLPRSADLIVAPLAVLEAGGAYVPLDSSHPRERLAAIVADAGARVAITTSGLRDGLPAGIAAVCLDRDAEAIGRHDDTVLDLPASPAQLAYAIFTSGSTGRPKGVMVEHRAVASLVGALAEAVYARHRGRLDVALVASTAFDASVQQIFASLLLGHTLHVADDDTRRSGAGLLDFFAAHRIALADGTPSLLGLLLDAGLGRREGLVLEHLLIGGEALPTRLIERLHAQDTARRILVTNVYGPTECGVDDTFRTVEPGERLRGMHVPLGRPLANARVYVVDRDGLPVPPGVPGEIRIGGPCLARGYLGQPALTARAFGADPFVAGARLYATGDRGRWTGTGEIEFLGRGDDQVKVRGHRVEPAEIESVLLRHPGVREAAVVARREGEEAARLVAYIAARGAVPTVTDLREHLAGQLPPYMVPAIFLVLERLPLNASGKVDRARLPRADAAQELAQGTEHLAPRDERERALAAAWALVTGRSAVGAADNFFSIGGDSIRALQVVAKLRQAGWRLDLRELFERPTLAQLAPRLVPFAASTTAPADAAGPVPLGPVQASFLREHPGPRHHFHQALLLGSVEPVDVHALDLALAAVHGHHAALRMRFRETDGKWLQDCARDQAAPVAEVVDLSREDSPVAAMRAHAAAAMAATELARGPLVIAVLYRLPGAERLLLAAHHLVVDGVSWRIVIEDLGTAYAQARDARVVSLLPASDSFASWAARLHDLAASAPEDERRYWAGVEEAPSAALPLDGPAARATHADRGELRLALSAELTALLLSTAHEAYGTRMDDLLLTALGRALLAWTGGTRWRVLLEGHGREPLAEGADATRTVGWFTARYPVLLDLDGPDDVGRQVKGVKEMLRRVPRGGATWEAQRLAAPALRPLPPIAFNYLGQLGDELRAGPWRWLDEDTGATIAREAALVHDLEIIGFVSGGQLHVAIAHGRTRLATGKVAALAAGFERELATVVEHTSRRERELTPSDIDFDGFDAETLDAFVKTLQ
jgi:amino acid adenylation domain-containing protein/non-ribosomal peptide synthase protein (TIGR01720 family)